ncbi:AAA family ATPase [Ferruginibacter sp.]|nr:ATP-binding protein [Ferruginibacter sp.]
MSEILHIKNFGPIKDVKLEIKKFNVIIGENATGKSTIAKLLSFCRYFTNIQGGYYDEKTQENKNHGLEEIEEKLRKWGLFEYIRKDSFVSYECKDYKYTFDNRIWESGGFSAIDNKYYDEKVYHLTSSINPITNEFRNLLDEYYLLENGGKLSNEFFENFVADVLENPFFIYTERGLQSIFSLGKDFTSNLSDPLFRYFVDMDKISRSFKGVTAITPLKIEYKNIDGKSEIRKMGENDFTNLHNAASGYKSLIPIVLVIEYYNKIRKKKKTFIIEEPELNLFPKVQRELMNYLIAETTNKDNQVLLTTHSPYTLTSLNNLMYAFEIGKKNYEEVNKIIESKCWVSPDNVSAYMLLPDGTCEAIMDREENLIRAEKIDNISGFLNEQFDALLNIELIEK